MKITSIFLLIMLSACDPANEPNTTQCLSMSPCTWATAYTPAKYDMGIPEGVCSPSSCILTIMDHEDQGLNALIRHVKETICVRIVKNTDDPGIKTPMYMFGFDLLPDRRVKINGKSFEDPSPYATVYESATFIASQSNQLNKASDGYNYVEITPTQSTTFPYDDMRPLMWHFVDEVKPL